MTNMEMSNRVFLGLVIFREARGEPTEARVAVAFSVLNRVSRPSWWGYTILQVIFKKWQYSSMTDPHDPQLTVWPGGDLVAWEACLQIACDAIDGKLENPVPGADSYFDRSIPPPAWTKDARFVAQIGKLMFYDVDHDYQKEVT